MVKFFAQCFVAGMAAGATAALIRNELEYPKDKPRKAALAFGAVGFAVSAAVAVVTVVDKVKSLTEQ